MGNDEVYEQTGGQPKATLCIALSGRHWAWPMTAGFLERQEYPHGDIHLKILDTSGDAGFGDMVREWLRICDYGGREWLQREFDEPGLADKDRPTHTDAVRRVCAAIYREFAALAESPLVFTLEDDVVPEPDVYPRLVRLLEDNVVTASASYLGRLVADPISWRWDSDGQPVTYSEPGGVFEVGGHGFGAAVFRAEVFDPERFHAGGPLFDFDFNYFHRLHVDEGRSSVVDGDCIARHYSGPSSWVQTPATARRLMTLRGAPSRLSIVHLNSYDNFGGAERFAQNLIKLQRDRGHDSVALVGQKMEAGSDAVSFDLEFDPADRTRHAAAGRPDYEFRGSHGLPNHPAVRHCDVVHISNLAGFFHPWSLIALSNAKPVVWSIHDMQPITGYCSHALDCKRWENGCGQCPDLSRPGPKLPFDNTEQLWRDKEIISENSRLWIVAPSSWMEDKLRASLLSRHPVHLIPNGIDTSVFRSINKLEARKQLGLPEDAVIIGALARDGVFAHPWKGGPTAAAVFDALKKKHANALFLDIGGTENTSSEGIRPLLPADDSDIVTALSALDLLIHPSVADTAPLSVLEAMSCGVPVAGFAVGGLTDMVTEETGFLAEEGDTEELAKAVIRLTGDTEVSKNMAIAARSRAIERFDIRLMQSRYDELYAKAIVEHAGELLPTHTVGESADRASRESVHEIKRLQDKCLNYKEKLNKWRAKYEKEQEKIDLLLGHRWTKLGSKLGVFRRTLRKWISGKKHS